jgi:opine dehydrogenase
VRIAVIGGGNGAYAAAAHLSDEGHEVRLWRRDAAALAALGDAATLALTDWRGTREVALDIATGDLAAALGGAELVVVPLPATTHRALAAEMAPHLEAGQVVFLPPGTFASYLFAVALREAGNSATVAFAETGTLPYLARKQAEDHVRISVYATRLPTGVFPAVESARALAIIGEAYPAVEPLTDALDGALMNAGPIIHPPLILMNAGPLEHFEAWDIHNEGTQPSIRRVTDALDAERVALREALGYGPPHFPLADHYDDERDEWMYGNASHRRLTDSGDWREKIDLRHHRYMLEDTILGLSFLASLGDRVDLQMPITHGLHAIGRAVASGAPETRTLQDLGLAELSADGLANVLKEGVAR